jgi:hypothetical protein
VVLNLFFCFSEYPEQNIVIMKSNKFCCHDFKNEVHGWGKH